MLRMSSSMKIELLYFQGCPNLEAARGALRQALAAERVDAGVVEIDLEAADSPEWARGWGSPTILIDGNELTGATPSSGATCRLYEAGAPTVDEIRAGVRAARRRAAETSGRATLSMVGAVTAALAASACCLVPAALAAVGLSGAGFGAALAPYRIYFLIGTGVALAVAFWLVYRKRKDACGCAIPRARRVTRIALWGTTVVAVALMAHPLLADGSAQAGDKSEPARATLRLNVRGMDCRECTATIASRIKKVEGVVSASVDYESGIAVVRHDGRAGLDAAAIAAVKDAGFTATVHRDPPAP
jgi:mercuric ion transport protein